MSIHNGLKPYLPVERQRGVGAVGIDAKIGGRNPVLGEPIEPAHEERLAQALPTKLGTYAEPGDGAFHGWTKLTSGSAEHALADSCDLTGRRDRHQIPTRLITGVVSEKVHRTLHRQLRKPPMIGKRFIHRGGPSG